MSNWHRMSREAPRYKDLYPAGTRIELDHMGDDPRPIEPGTRGTVRFVDDLGTIHCDFDNGRRLGLVPGEDVFHKLTARELEEERHSSSLEAKMKDASSRTARKRGVGDDQSKEAQSDIGR